MIHYFFFYKFTYFILMLYKLNKFKYDFIYSGKQFEIYFLKKNIN